MTITDRDPLVAMTEYKGILYVATTKGLFRLVDGELVAVPFRVPIGAMPEEQADG